MHRGFCSLARSKMRDREPCKAYHARNGRRQASAIVRSRKRYFLKERKRSSVRFWLLVLSIVATAVIVTVAMFESLYYLLG